jgi:hypothetical protein
VGTGEIPASSFIEVSDTYRTGALASRCHVCSVLNSLHRSLLHYHSFLTAVPTAELEPITETYVQADEVRVVLRRLQLPPAHATSAASRKKRPTWG